MPIRYFRIFAYLMLTEGAGTGAGIGIPPLLITGEAGSGSGTGTLPLSPFNCFFASSPNLSPGYSSQGPLFDEKQSPPNSSHVHSPPIHSGKL